MVFAMRGLVVGGLNTHLTKPPGEYKNKHKTQKHQLNSAIPGRESRKNDSRPGIVDSRPGIVSQIQIDLAGSGRMKANRKTQESGIHGCCAGKEMNHRNHKTKATMHETLKYRMKGVQERRILFS